MSASAARSAVPSDALEEEAVELASDGELAGIEEAMDVHEALAGLEPPCREMLDRFFARDEPYRVIADALGLPMGTVASRISRCSRQAAPGARRGKKSPSEPSGD